METRFNELSNAEQVVVLLDSKALYNEVKEGMIQSIDESIEYQFENLKKDFETFDYGVHKKASIELKNDSFNSIYHFALALDSSNKTYYFLNAELEGCLNDLLERLELEEEGSIEEGLESVKNLCNKVLRGLEIYLEQAYTKLSSKREVVNYFFSNYITEIDDMQNCFYNTEEEVLYRYKKESLK